MSIYRASAFANSVIIISRTVSYVDYGKADINCILLHNKNGFNVTGFMRFVTIYEFVDY